MSSSDIVKLDIGGTVFKTTKSTLTKYDGFFKTLLETNVTVEKDESGCIFVDRSPKNFDLILNFMRDGDVLLPSSEQDVHEILKEAQYYLLEGLIELCGKGPEVSKGVRVVQNYEEMQQLRDRSKSLLFIGFSTKYSSLQAFSANFPHNWNIVRSFVEKHESRFDIFFRLNDSHSSTYTINFVGSGQLVYGWKEFENVEALFVSVEECIAEDSSN